MNYQDYDIEGKIEHLLAEYLRQYSTEIGTQNIFEGARAESYDVPNVVCEAQTSEQILRDSANWKTPCVIHIQSNCWDQESASADNKIVAEHRTRVGYVRAKFIRPVNELVDELNEVARAIADEYVTVFTAANFVPSQEIDGSLFINKLSFDLISAEGNLTQ